MDEDFKTICVSAKRKRRKESKPKVLSDTSEGFGARCPVCQFPFVKVKEREKHTHIDKCKGARTGAKECPNGLRCHEKENQHFHIFSHFKLALSRSHEESKLIKKDKDSLIKEDKNSLNNDSLLNISMETSDDQDNLYKRQKISETVTSTNCNNSDNFLFGHLIGQVIYSDEIVTSKQMTVNYGVLKVSCEICNKIEENLIFNPHVKINYSSNINDCKFIPTLRLHPLELNMNYNEQGWKKISINYFPGFQVRQLELKLGNCCHFIEMKCVVGIDDGIQEVETKSFKTLAFFDFASLGLNCCESSEKNLLEKLWFNSDTFNIKKETECMESKTNIIETSDNDTPGDPLYEKSFLDAFNESFTLPEDDLPENNVTLGQLSEDILPEDTILDQKDAVEKWKNLFKKKNSIHHLSTTTATPLPSFSETPKFGKKPCPFYKRIPGTSFAVDAFRYGAVPGVSHYFLTHFHSDHYGGLTKSFKQRIICSSVTAALVAKKLYVERKYLYVVKHMETFTIGNVKITPLDANHCPGSFMFLFQLHDGNCYLHVGDFRACSQMEKYQILSGITVNVLFLDTTYCNPLYQFPTQEEVVEGAIRISLKQIRLEPATLIVSGTYTIGKEKVFMGIANALKSNIWAPKGKRDVLMCLNDKDLNSKLVEHPRKAQVHVWPMMNLNHQCLEQHLRDCLGAYKCILAFNPSGWNYKNQCAIEDIPAVRRGNVTIISIPYSEHSSYDELRRFVKFLKPVKVVPTVASRNQSFSAISQCCNKWLREPEEKIVSDRQRKLTSFFTKND